MKKKQEENKLSEKVCSPREISILSFAALSNFKNLGRRRRGALSARSGLQDPRPPKQDTNIWSELLGRHRGYTYAARVLSRILKMVKPLLHKRNPSDVQCYQKAMQILFAAEKENSYNTIKNRRGTP